MKKKSNIILIILATLIVLYFSMKDDYKLVIDTILNINKGYLLIGFLLLGSFYFFKAIAIWLITHNFKKTYRFREAVRMVLETNFFHAVTPFSTGGQPYEVYSLKKSGLSLLNGTNVSIEGFITYQIALVLLGTVSIIANYIFNFFPDNALLAKLVTLGFILNFLVIVMLFILTFTKRLSSSIVNFFINLFAKIKIVKDKEKTKEKFKNYLVEFHRGATILLKNKGQFVGCIFLQLISLISLYLIPFVLIMGAHIPYVNPLIVVITSAYVMLIGSFVPIPGGTGGLEYGFVAFFSNFIVGKKVNAIMLLWRFITYYAGMILGAILLSTKKEKYK